MFHAFSLTRDMEVTANNFLYKKIFDVKLFPLLIIIHNKYLYYGLVIWKNLSKLS